MLDRRRVAMIGAGGMVNCVHHPSLASFDDVGIAAICDLDPEWLKGTDEGIHVIDTLRWMCGGDMVDVQSLTRRVLAMRERI